MRKLMVVLFLLAATVLGMAMAPTAQADVSVAGLTPFTPEANFMSLPGYYRWRNFIDTGRWISREEAVQAVRAAGGPV